MRCLLESLVNVNGTRIQGTAIIPRVSKNDILYLPNELKQNAGKTIPLNVMHEDPIRKVGEVKLSWDENKQELTYDGIITDSKIAELVRRQELFVSVGADFQTKRETCDSKTCYDTPIGLNIIELSIVDQPGIPQASLKVIESFTSLVHENFQNRLMTNETSSDNSNETKEKECEPGFHFDINTNQCVKNEEAAKTCSCNSESQPKEDYKEILTKVVNNQQEQLKLLTGQLGLKTQESQIARVSTEDNSIEKITAQEFKNGILKNGGNFSWELSLTDNQISESFGYADSHRVQEAITISGQSEKRAVSRPIVLLPGGKYFKSIRNLVQFDTFPQGSDTIELLLGDIPDEVTRTEGTATSESTHVVTAKTMTADTVTGWFQRIKLADIEKTPGNLLNYLNQSARAETMHREAVSVFKTSADAATPTQWMRADTQATISADDTSGIVFAPKAIGEGVKTLKNNGYIDGITCLLGAKQMKELREHTDLTRFVNEGKPQINEDGVITRLYGADLIEVPDSLLTFDNTTNDAIRAIMFKRNHTFWLGSARDMRIRTLEAMDRLTLDVSFSKRLNSQSIDDASLVRISSTL